MGYAITKVTFMKQYFVLFSVLSLIFVNSTAKAANLWTKYVAPDRTYSFHYPKGWKVNPATSLVAVEDPRTDEQLLMVVIPFDQRKSPKELANGFIAVLRDGNPNIQASNWTSQKKSNGDQVVFNLADEQKGKQYSGLGLVIKNAKQATWFSYLAPANGYFQARGSAILQGFLGSLASGPNSKTPTIAYAAYSGDALERNAWAFIFVLEYALGAPFTAAQEQTLLEEIKNAWRSNPKDRSRREDQYPALVQSILRVKSQKEHEELRATLEKTIRTWLNESDPTDKTVKVVRDQMLAVGRILVPGDPPLTEMAAIAYSEMVSFADVLQKNPEATPDQIPRNSVVEVRKDILKAWKSLSKDSKQAVAGTPGIWICYRELLRSGTKTEKNLVLNQLRQLSSSSRGTQEQSSSKANAKTATGASRPMDPTSHWALMQMQKQTFNTYMWSRGFNYSPTYGRRP